jgi:D-glycero-D-manno-heptose 1,7-bisphosphate phosphatase
MKKKAVFLDRDGTINVDVGYPSSFDQIRVYPYAFEALRKLNEAGFLAVIITNQSGVGRGFFTEDALRDLHDRLLTSFARRGVRVDAIYYCPHYDPAEPPERQHSCSCRKPNPEMGQRAAADLDLDLRASYMIGDKVEDIEFGWNIGATPVLVRTGFGAAAERLLLDRPLRPAAVADTLLDAVDWILHREKGGP